VALFMKLISLHLSYSFLVGAASLYFVSLWQKDNPMHLLLKFLIISFPLFSGYYLLIISELEGLWFALPVFALIIFTGLLSHKNWPKYWFASALVITTCLIAFLVIPKSISNDLMKEISEPAPDYTLENLLNEDEITHQSMGNHVVILDFFGTWCAPCIAEMKELQQIKERLSSYESQLKFIIVCTDKGGDTPEKALKFHAKRQLPFLLAYDSQAVVHHSFGFTGVPGLAVIDKKGKLRLKHEGYNQAENLEDNLIAVLEEILNE